MSSSEDAQAFGRSDFWDARYAKADGGEPTHEWLGAFDAMEPFLEKRLFNSEEHAGKERRILHLGSGDSVGPLTLFAVIPDTLGELHTDSCPDHPV
jgi:hypothetical protein